MKRDIEPVKKFYEKTAEKYDKDYETPYWKLYNEITWEKRARLLERIRNFNPSINPSIPLSCSGRDHGR